MLEEEKKSLLATVIRCAKLYKANLCNRNFMFIYEDDNGGYKRMETLFQPRHFQHLTGLIRAEDVTSTQFYRKCIDGKLSFDDFVIPDDGTPQLKALVLEELMQLNVKAKMLGDYNYSKPHLFTDKVIGNIRGCMGFVSEMGHDFWVPNTALCEDIRDITTNRHKLVAVYQKNIKDPKYNVLCYLAKPLKLASLKWPESIEARIDMDSTTPIWEMSRSA